MLNLHSKLLLATPTGIPQPFQQNYVLVWSFAAVSLSYPYPIPIDVLYKGICCVLGVAFGSTWADPPGGTFGWRTWQALLTGSPSVTSPTPCHVNSIYLSETHSTYVATVHFILQLWSLIKDDMIDCLSLVPGTVTVESRAKVRKLGHLGPNYKQMWKFWSFSSLQPSHTIDRIFPLRGGGHNSAGTQGLKTPFYALFHTCLALFWSIIHTGRFL